MTKHFSWQQAVLESDRSAGCKLVLMVVGSFMNQHGEGAWPAVATIGRLASVGRTSVKRHLAEAEAAGWIVITRRPKGNGDNDTNQYRISYPQPGSTVDQGRPTVDPPGPMVDLGGGPMVDPEHPIVFNTPENTVEADKPATVDNFAEIQRETDAHKVIGYLNGYTGHQYKATPAVVKLITARLKDGYTVEDLQEVTERKCNEWKGTKMEQYLRPKTLFNATNFESYAGQRGTKFQVSSSGEAEDCRWWESAKGIETMAFQCNIEQKAGEPFWKFKCRTAKKANDRAAMDVILADMARTGNAAYGETARYFGVYQVEGMKP